MNEYLIDTSAWIEYLLGTERGAVVAGLVEEGEAAISILTIAELSCWLAARGDDGKKHIAFLQNHTQIFPLSIDVCKAVGALKKSQRKQERSFGTSDGLIYLTAREQKLTLLTKDRDFVGLEGVQVLS